MMKVYRKLVRPIAITLGGQTWLPGLNTHIVGFDRKLQSVTRGRFMLVNLAGLEGLVLTVPGVKTGISRTTPLLCVPADGGWLIAGSNWGGPKPPAWVANLLAVESAHVRFRGVDHRVTPREQTGVARAAAWETMRRTWPNYDKYAAQTAREIRVFFLDPR